MFFVGYVQFMGRERLHAALCSCGYGDSAVASNLSCTPAPAVNAIASYRSNDCLRPFGSLQSGSDVITHEGNVLGWQQVNI
jgi:hypothetical protein